MKKLARLQYRGALRGDVQEDALRVSFAACERILQERKDAGELYTAGIFRYRDMVFLYMELIYEDRSPMPEVRPLADEWLTPLRLHLKLWPEAGGDRSWAYMTPVFWFDVPESLERYARAVPPDKRCGRIARLYDDKAMSYITHHQAIAAEGLLVGDRYQFISVHENILFSYFETPRDREQVNVRRACGHSVEMDRWAAVDPDSHFDRFPEEPGENFMVIDTVASV